MAKISMVSFSKKKVYCRALLAKRVGASEIIGDRKLSNLEYRASDHGEFSGKHPEKIFKKLAGLLAIDIKTYRAMVGAEMVR